ncbi:hypothetical protein JCM3766R1_006931 [Sporobolomyces carnicolor]
MLDSLLSMPRDPDDREDRPARPRARTARLLDVVDPSHPLFVMTATTVALTASYWGYTRFAKRIRTVQDLVLPTRSFKGTVTSVGDADNFRVYHQPLLKTFSTVPTKRSQLKGETIHVRLAGVDAPEMAHFGKPAQPYSQEAFDFLNELVSKRRVVVEPFERDRYERVVSMCYVRRRTFPWLVRGKRVNVSEEMLKAGLATVYKQAGAVHDGKLKRFEELERKAKMKRLGMWSIDSRAYESPAEYKKRISAP